MTTLHLIASRLSAHSELAQQLQQALSNDDSLVFMAQGIYSITSLPLSYSQRMYVLAADVAATAINVPENINIIDYAQFVALGARHERSLSWSE